MYTPSDDYQAINDALVSAYPTRGDLTRLLFVKLGKRLDDYVGAGGLRVLVPELMIAAESDGWLDALADAVVLDKPANPRVREFAERRRRERSVAPEAGPAFEATVRADLPMVDPIRFLEGMLKSIRPICRVDVDNRAAGTGFLVAPDLVLTNHHVVDSLLPSKPDSYKRVRCVFDFRDGASSKDVDCHPDWLVASSPPSPLDLQVLAERRGKEPSATELDYALLRLAARPGDELVSGVRRGYLEPRSSAASYRADGPLYILQHPNGGTLRWGLDTKAIIELNRDKTRLRYRTNTEHGSSGAPCFDEVWNLVALHHSGEAGYRPARFNEGIPVETIFEHLPETAKTALATSRTGATP
ncbi:MAG: trypsin-like peptidase domain-containing protein [Polyangiaceae bacterium]